MRKLYIFLLMVLVEACSPSGYEIDGTVNGISEGKVYMISFLKTVPDTLAVAQVRDGHFHVEGECLGVIPALLMVDGQGMGGIPIYLEKGRYHVELDARDVRKWRIEGGGESQRLSNEYQQIDRCANQAVDSIRDEFMEAIKEPESPRFLQLRAHIDSILLVAEERRMLFLKQHADSYLALNDCAVRAYAMALEDLQAAFGRFSEEMQNSYAGKAIAERIQKMESLAPGRIAPDFTLATPDGESFTMHSVKAKVKLLDFWASWCAPCRVLIPQLRDLYQELHPQGFEILGISFDDRRDVWARAIEEERMSWPQGSDLKGFQPGLPLTELYAISGIPHMVLLDGDNRIVLVNPSMEQLEKEIVRLLKK